MAKDFDVIVIGGGVAGLTAAAYLAQAGMSVGIFEQQHKLGGLAGAFSRRDFLFEQALQWIVSCHPGGTIYNCREELGLTLSSQLDPWCRQIGPGFDAAFLQCEGMGRGAVPAVSQGSGAIQRLTADALKLFRRIPDTPRKPNDMLTKWEKLKIGLMTLLNMKLYRKYLGISIQDLLVQEFKDPQVRTFFYSLCPAGSASALLLLTTIGWIKEGRFYYPVGGGQAIIDSLRQVIVENGGEIICGRAVERILVEDDRAVGVVLSGGDEVGSDYVAAACDAMQLYSKMLPPGAVPDYVLENLKELEPWTSYFLISLGVDDSVTQLGSWHHHITYCPALMDAQRRSNPPLINVVDNSLPITSCLPGCRR